VPKKGGRKKGGERELFPPFAKKKEGEFAVLVEKKPVSNPRILGGKKERER